MRTTENVEMERATVALLTALGGLVPDGPTLPADLRRRLVEFRDATWNAAIANGKRCTRKDADSHATYA